MNSLKKYNFKDEQGHPLENCQDFIELVHRASSAESSLAAMRQRAEEAEARAAEEEKSCEEALKERDELEDILGNLAACFDQEFSSSYGPESISHDITELQENRDIWQSKVEGLEKKVREAISRAERAEDALRDFVSILSIPHPVEHGTYKELLTTAFGHAKELLGMVPDPGASPPADASTMGGDHSADATELVEGPCPDCSHESAKEYSWHCIGCTSGGGGRERRLVEALEAISRRAPIAGSRDEYRRGQLDALEACREVALAALAEMEQKS